MLIQVVDFRVNAGKKKMTLESFNAKIVARSQRDGGWR